MKLNTLSNTQPRKSGKRVGRGIGSGKGKTAGRGHKGQKARAGAVIKGFEGGQMPLHRRLPKRGFNSWRPTKYQVINTGDLQRIVDAKKLEGKGTVTKKILYEVALIRKMSLPVKVLAKGELKVSLTLEADAVSEKAHELIKKAGGTVILPVKKEKDAA